MAYNGYKKTAESWVETIPLSWDIKRLKSLFSFGKGLTITKDDLTKSGIPVISYGQIHNKNNPGTRVIKELIRYVPSSLCIESSQVHKGDFIIADTSEDYTGCGNSVFIDTDDVLFAGYHTIILRSLCDENNNQYLSYLFLTDGWRNQIRKEVKGVKLFSITRMILSNTKVILPPRNEQDQIVRYLDWKISRINMLIHGYQKQIRLIRERTETITCQAVLRGLDQSVELKESGIQNIDKIPVHWRVLQNKRIFEERSEYSVSGDETLLSISKHYGVKKYHDLEDGEQFATIKPAESLVGYKKVMKNDLAMNIMRARNGSFGISDYDGIVSSAYAVFKPIIELNPKYMYYLLRTPHIIGIFESYSYGIAEHRRRLYPVDFLRLYLPVPPIYEQDQIVNRVEKVQKDAERILSQIQRQIDLLREYRTRLISDVVTGQIDVRGIVIPDYTSTEDTESDSETCDNEEVVADAE